MKEMKEMKEGNREIQCHWATICFAVARPLSGLFFFCEKKGTFLMSTFS